MATVKLVLGILIGIIVVAVLGGCAATGYHHDRVVYVPVYAVETPPWPYHQVVYVEAPPPPSTPAAQRHVPLAKPDAETVAPRTREAQPAQSVQPSEATRAGAAGARRAR